MNQEEKLAAVAELFEVDTVKSEQTLDTLQWDSMAMLSLIALAKARCNKRITGAELKTFKTVQDILNAL